MEIVKFFRNILFSLNFTHLLFCYATPPIVLWHGMGNNAAGMAPITKLIQQNLPDTYVYAVQIGKTLDEDTSNTYWMNVNDQVTLVCQMLANDAKLQSGYNAIGFSQGGQFMRAVAQRCPSPAMKNFISIGGQHQGVYGISHCPGKSTVCNLIRRLLNIGAYKSYIQDKASYVQLSDQIMRMQDEAFYPVTSHTGVVQAEYWHDPLNEQEYREKSILLADINQERVRNERYKDNLLKLKNMVLVKFLKDTTVLPKESEWFGFYKPGQSKALYTLQESPLYLEDWLGLKQLNDTGRLHFLSSDTDHGKFSDDWFIQNILKPYLV